RCGMPLLFRKADLEDYVLIDHRDSPGFSCDIVADAGRSQLAPYVGAGKKFEGATLYCNHCERIVIKNPDRTRHRASCPKCDHFICDWCAGEYHRTLQCVPFKKVIEDFLT